MALGWRTKTDRTGIHKPELVEQGAGLMTARLEPWTLAGWGGARRFRLCPELPELPGAEVVPPLSTVMPTGGVGSRFTRDLLFDISPACFNTWYIRSTSGLSGEIFCLFNSRSGVEEEVLMLTYTILTIIVQNNRLS